MKFLFALEVAPCKNCGAASELSKMTTQHWSAIRCETCGNTAIEETDLELWKRWTAKNAAEGAEVQGQGGEAEGAGSVRSDA